MFNNNIKLKKKKKIKKIKKKKNKKYLIFEILK